MSAYKPGEPLALTHEPYFVHIHLGLSSAWTESHRYEHGIIYRHTASGEDVEVPISSNLDKEPVDPARILHASILINLAEFEGNRNATEADRVELISRLATLADRKNVGAENLRHALHAIRLLADKAVQEAGEAAPPDSGPEAAVPAPPARYAGEKAETSTGVGCPEHPGRILTYIATYGAPGVGWHGQCPVDGRDWSVVGGTAYDPEQEAHILTPEDVR